MYVRMYDELKKNADDNPTIGIMLCTDTDEDIAKYSILKGNERLFATKYKLYLPSEEELRSEIENQKLMFELQQKNLQKWRLLIIYFLFLINSFLIYNMFFIIKNQIINRYI